MSYSAESVAPRSDFQHEQSWGNRQPTFSELDKNGDNLINREEAKKWDSLNKSFDSVDQDQNDAIDQSEFGDFETKKIKESIKGFIKN
ncbi:hypothetical protein [Candidatus Nitrosacidococcus sp. I8]|uniref:hypothetical protein n=1 Tax=Candidatus Nitrosacidococcus sp. I8 TaxID=2942908 RepID=UPI00222797E5|nr:hypothetical protein [Candidatus Nitrosacidococcus sp. I8]